jgi:hypothetical protein
MDNNTPGNEPGPTSLETLMGGNQITIRFEDGHQELVNVRQVPLKQYRELMEAQANEFRFIELVCEKPENWAENMKPADYNALVDEANRINADFFAWCARQIQRVERLAPGFMDRAARQATTPQDKPSPTTRPRSPLLPA